MIDYSKIELRIIASDPVLSKLFAAGEPILFPTAAQFAADGHNQVPPGDRKEWEHDFYSSKVSFVRFKHTVTGRLVTCPNMWYNGTPQSSIDRREFWIAEGREREKYWTAREDCWEKRDNLAHILKMREQHLTDIEHIKATGEVM